MKRTLTLAPLLACLAMAGCDDPARNLFEGIRNNNEAQRTPQEREMKPAPSYDEYTKERKRVENGDSARQ
jgi:hypothetical protein